MRFRLAIIGLLTLLWPLSRAAAAPLRLCVDPDNPPFSSSNPESPGFYTELGHKIAASLGRSLEVIWAPTAAAKREIANTLLAGHCDGFIGLPDEADFMPSRLIFSKPLLTLGYALVAAHGTTISDLAALSGKRVAVQYATPPQYLLAEHDDITMVTVSSPREGMHDLAAGTADAAILWGPAAGWIDRTSLHNAYSVTPLSGTGMRWQAAIAFATNRSRLRDAVDRSLGELGGSIQALKVKYGLSTATPVALAQPHTNDPPVVGPKDAVVSAKKSSANIQEISAGHQIFNNNCEHCHGPDAVTGIEARNLRHLRVKYGRKMNQVFLYTVTHGRPTKGMPDWSGILTHTQFEKILAYLHSIQEK